MSYNISFGELVGCYGAVYYRYKKKKEENLLYIVNGLIFLNDKCIDSHKNKSAVMTLDS